MKVCINPTYSPTDRTEGGIRRVVEAMLQYLPEFDIETVVSADGADLIVNHGTYTERRDGIPTVAACHGLYWSGYAWDAWAGEANKAVTANMIAAQAITVPSNWVGMAVARGLWRPTHTIYHGVNADEWTHSYAHRGYVLWNKARTDPVSDHRDVDKLAERMPEQLFASTFAEPRTNVRITGVQSFQNMKALVQCAGVYLQTARETGAIGTMEALAAGVPVVGWAYGAQEEIIRNGDTGYLATPGNYDELAECVARALAERERLSSNAIMDARERWGWIDKIQMYADLFYRVRDEGASSKPHISIVVTCYNLGRYLPEAIKSIADQDLELNEYEIIIVDDRSTDNSFEIAKQLEGYYKSRGPYRIDVIRPAKNLGLSQARNLGALRASGKYLLFLDADDMLGENALPLLSDYLDHHALVSIAYGKLDTISEDGTNRQRNPWPEGPFNYVGQLAHLNQMSYAAMMRYEVWANTGGYRERDWRAEDASFWLRATSFGYYAALATSQTTLIYRMRSGSKSGVERSQYADIDGDWTSWFPWRIGVSSGQEGTERMQQQPSPVPNANVIPFGAQGKAPAPLPMWPVHHHQEPAVSIIIPVAPWHTKYVVDALDSVMAQTCPSWEVIVVYDNSQVLPTEEFPWARFVYSDGSTLIPPYDPLGAGAARNVGIKLARAPLCLFLDGDDLLRPQAVEQFLAQYTATGGYVYCDTTLVQDDSHVADVVVGEWRNLPYIELGSNAEQPVMIVPSTEWDQREFLASGYDGVPGRHSVTALVATVDALGVGGFDEEMSALEDWEFFLRLAASGIEGHHLRDPLLIYRLDTGTRREGRRANEPALQAIMRRRYLPFVSGEQPMCSCNSGGGGQKAQLRGAAALAGLLPPEFNMHDYAHEPADHLLPALVKEQEKVRLRYVGDRYGAVAYKGKVTKQVYRAGLDPAFEFIDVEPVDLEGLLLSGQFKVTT